MGAATPAAGAGRTPQEKPRGARGRGRMDGRRSSLTPGLGLSATVAPTWCCRDRSATGSGQEYRPLVPPGVRASPGERRQREPARGAADHDSLGETPLVRHCHPKVRVDPHDSRGAGPPGARDVDDSARWCRGRCPWFLPEHPQAGSGRRQASMSASASDAGCRITHGTGRRGRAGSHVSARFGSAQLGLGGLPAGHQPLDVIAQLGLALMQGGELEFPGCGRRRRLTMAPADTRRGTCRPVRPRSVPERGLWQFFP